MAERVQAKSPHAITLRQMRIFLLTVENASASAAARRLGISQSAVSQQLLEMERNLRVPLFERAGIRMLPTQAARALIDPVRQALAAADRIEPTIANFRNDGTGLVRLGTGATACIHFLPEALARTRAQMPHLQIMVVTGNSGDIMDGVENGAIDVGLITADFTRPNAMIHLEEILHDDLVAALPSSAAKLLPDVLRPRDLARLPLILFEPGGHTRQIINTWFSADSVKPVPTMELGSIEAIKTLVGVGLGGSIIPRLAAPASTLDVVYRPLEPTLQRRLCLALRVDKKLDTGLRTLLSEMRAIAEHIR